MENSSIQKIILFDTTRDRKTGFLCSESNHSFVLEEKRWPTVEHYVQAKKFEGTEYEEVIRNSPTVYQAIRLAQPRVKIFSASEGQKTSLETYGKKKNKEYNIREDWNNICAEILKVATVAKFSQNPQLQGKLMETRNARLVCTKNENLGPILEKIRKKILPQKEIVNKYIETNTTQDFPTANLSEKDRIFVGCMIQLSLRVAREEGCSKVYEGMVEDAVFSISSVSSKKIIQYMQKTQKMSWSDMYRNMPNYVSIINEIQELFTGKDPSQEENLNPSALLGGLVMWLNCCALPKQKKHFYGAFEKDICISLQKKKRAYRKSPYN